MPGQPPQPRYWFPAKRYGWGWGLPSTWQGWVILLIWIVALAAGYSLLPARPIYGHFFFIIAMSLGLIGVCLWKGEPPRWRWGN